MQRVLKAVMGKYDCTETHYMINNGFLYISFKFMHISTLIVINYKNTMDRSL